MRSLSNVLSHLSIRIAEFNYLRTNLQTIDATSFILQPPTTLPESSFDCQSHSILCVRVGEGGLLVVKYVCDLNYKLHFISWDDPPKKT